MLICEMGVSYNCPGHYRGRGMGDGIAVPVFLLDDYMYESGDI